MHILVGFVVSITAEDTVQLKHQANPVSVSSVAISAPFSVSLPTSGSLSSSDYHSQSSSNVKHNTHSNSNLKYVRFWGKQSKLTELILVGDLLHFPSESLNKLSQSRFDKGETFSLNYNSNFYILSRIDCDYPIPDNLSILPKDVPFNVKVLRDKLLAWSLSDPFFVALRLHVGRQLKEKQQVAENQLAKVITPLPPARHHASPQENTISVKGTVILSFTKSNEHPKLALVEDSTLTKTSMVYTLNQLESLLGGLGLAPVSSESVHVRLRHEERLKERIGLLSKIPQTFRVSQVIERDEEGFIISKRYVLMD
jgi:hypothetical protein